MPGNKRVAASLALAASLAAVAGCGSSGASKTIAPTDASTLRTELADVQSAVANGDCPTARLRAHDFVTTVNGLPETVGASVKSELRTAGENLVSLAGDPGKCQPSGATGASGSQTTTSSAPPATTTSSSAPTTTKSAPPPKPAPQGNQGGGQGGGGGNGGGGTGGTGTGGTSSGGGKP